MVNLHGIGILAVALASLKIEFDFLLYGVILVDFREFFVNHVEFEHSII